METIYPSSVNAWYKQLADKITTSQNQEETVQEVIQLIINKGDNAISTNNHFVRTRKYLVLNGLTQDQARFILQRPLDEIIKTRQQMVENQIETNKIGISRILQFKNPSTLKKRLKQINLNSIPTIENLIDIITLFCMRTNEITTLKLHLNKQPVTISGFSKNKTNNPSEEREFICIYKPSQYKYINELLLWIQSFDLSNLIGSQNKTINEYLQINYNGATLKRLRKFGTDLILQYKHPKNPSQIQQLISKATRHQPAVNAEQAYGIINNEKLKPIQHKHKSTTQIEQEQKIYPERILGFKIVLNNKNQHIAQRKINQIKHTISLDAHYPNLEQRIINYCTTKNIKIPELQ